MASPKDCKMGSLVPPEAPEEAHEADQADPGEVEKVKARDRERGKGKYAQTEVPPPQEEPPAEDKPKTYIEIELFDDEGKPCAGEKYEIMSGGVMVGCGRLSDKGFARVDGLDPGNCDVKFPDLDKESWLE